MRALDSTGDPFPSKNEVLCHGECLAAAGSFIMLQKRSQLACTRLVFPPGEKVIVGHLAELAPRPAHALRSSSHAEPSVASVSSLIYHGAAPASTASHAAGILRVTAARTHPPMPRSRWDGDCFCFLAFTVQASVSLTCTRCQFLDLRAPEWPGTLHESLFGLGERIRTVFRLDDMPHFHTCGHHRRHRAQNECTNRVLRPKTPCCPAPRKRDFTRF
jgi:hypothetical protein